MPTKPVAITMIVDISFAETISKPFSAFCHHLQMIIGTKVIVYLYISHVGCTNKEVWLNLAVFYNLYTYEMSSFTDFIVIQEMQPCIITPLCSYLANCMYAHRLYMPNTLPFSYTAVLLLLIKTLHVYNEHVRFCRCSSYHRRLCLFRTTTANTIQYAMLI